jgi:hypothetical protein
MPLPKIIFTVILLLMGALFSIVPGLTRPDLFFAVTVSPDFRQTAAARRILQRFWMLVWTSTLAAVAVELATGLALISLLILAAGFLGALVSSHGRALAYAAAPHPVLEVNLAAPREGLPAGPIVTLLPVLSLAGLGLWVGLNWDRLPTHFPVQLGIPGAGPVGNHHPHRCVRPSGAAGVLVPVAGGLCLGRAEFVAAGLHFWLACGQ